MINKTTKNALGCGKLQFKHVIWNLTKKDIDMVNVIINIVELYDSIGVGHVFDIKSPVYTFDVTYHDLASSLGYLDMNPKVMSEINDTLDNLSKTHACIYYTQQSDRTVEHTTFLLKYTLSSTHRNHGRDLDKRFSMMLSTPLIKILRDNKNLFKQFYTHCAYDLRSKYTTLLYDAIELKSTNNQNKYVEFTFDELVELVDFDLEETSNTQSWTKMNGNILKRAIAEINEKTNINVVCSNLKEKKCETGRKQTSVIKFEVDATNHKTQISEFFNSDFLMQRKIAYYMEREISRKITDLKKFNDLKVRNEENYRFTERQKLSKIKSEFEARVKIQEWVNRIKYNDPINHGLVCFIKYKNHDYVTVNSDYILMDVETKQLLSSNAVDTYAKIHGFLEKDGDYALVDTDNKKEYSNSYSKG